ncbi:ImmA/IrrE family metallo-endopeptidase [Pleionea mediterranea]|uniref:Chagasin family peptidase inhibitor I42 n=1 Tax=Pleionea mediterranea TaxID=523701 RepID=A0A316FYS0_9GAMM|nr:ImmA/IrrE family metallo-endopeptidase [Pleionea mediterranea]PWK52846.1 chagasin family peptidase inhibitor I42 [Pleionea mediterranea]
MRSKRDKAILKGIQAAKELHYQLDTQSRLRSNEKRIDISSAVEHLELPMIFRPLKGLLGAYIPGEAPGIIITTERRLSIQRYTAAHELGHYYLQHNLSADDEAVIGRSTKHSDDIPLQELEAEAFAGEFLLPKKLLLNICRGLRLGKVDLKNPVNVYKISSRAGVSYEAAAIALLNYKFIDLNTYPDVKAFPRKECKQELLGSWERHVEKFDLDIICLNESDNNSHIKLESNDFVILELPEPAASGYLWQGMDAILNLKLLEDSRKFSETENLGGVVKRRLLLSGSGEVSVYLRLKRPWENDIKKEFSVSLDFSGRGIGLSKV